MTFFTLGNVCPAGAYCPAGSDSPSLCQAGYYLNATGNDDVTDCELCTPGYYCSGGGSEEPDGPCEAGWYCPGGQDDPRPFGYNCTLGTSLFLLLLTTCTLVSYISHSETKLKEGLYFRITDFFFKLCLLPGHYCPIGSDDPIRCTSGTYQDELGQSTCKVCPIGYYCDNVQDPVVLYNNSSCPEGYYCPLNSERANQYPCPRGTFNNLTNRVEEDDCQPCTGGMFCDQEGLSVPTGPCDAGKPLIIIFILELLLSVLLSVNASGSLNTKV